MIFKITLLRDFISNINNYKAWNEVFKKVLKILTKSSVKGIISWYINNF